MQLRDTNAKFWIEANVYHLDIRPILETGGEPFSVIMEAIHQLPQNSTLCLHVQFDPVPLKKRLSQSDYICDSHREYEDHWIVNINKK